MTKYSSHHISKARLEKLIEEKGYRLEDIANPICLKWSKENFNNVKCKAEIPDCIKNATLNELFAACPFSYGGAIYTMPNTKGEI